MWKRSNNPFLNYKWSSFKVILSENNSWCRFMKWLCMHIAGVRVEKGTCIYKRTSYFSCAWKHPIKTTPWCTGVKTLFHLLMNISNKKNLIWTPFTVIHLSYGHIWPPRYIEVKIQYYFPLWLPTYNYIKLLVF